MKTIYSKFFLSIAGTLITVMALAQQVNSSTIPFKEIQKKQFTDNFTAREIKKKELEIAPSQIILLNTAVERPIRKDKNRQKKKGGPK